MTTDYPDAATLEEKLAYHKEMERAANTAGDFTKAAHHRKMQEMLDAMKQMQPQKTPEQISDEDYKVAPTSADNEKMKKIANLLSTDRRATCNECGLTARNNQELQDHIRHAHKKVQ